MQESATTMGFHHENFGHEQRFERGPGIGIGALVGTALAIEGVATAGMLYRNYDKGNRECAAMGFPQNPLNCPEYSPTAYAAPPENYGWAQPQAPSPYERSSYASAPEQFASAPPYEQNAYAAAPEQYNQTPPSYANDLNSNYSASDSNSLDLSASPYESASSAQAPDVNCNHASRRPDLDAVERAAPDPDNCADALNAAELASLQN